MVQNNLHSTRLILTGVLISKTFGCIAPIRTLTKATDITSPFLYEYMRFLNCHRIHENNRFQLYSANCIRNTSCVGIHANAPLATTCSLTNTSRDEIMSVHNLWLINDAFERFQGTCIHLVCKPFYVLQYLFVFETLSPNTFNLL